MNIGATVLMGKKRTVLERWPDWGEKGDWKIENGEEIAVDAEGFDSANLRAYTGAMEIELTPELQAKLDRIASQQGRDAKSLVHEAVERLLDYDEWFIRQVEIGLAQAERGELLEHEKVVARMEDLISRKQRQP